MQGMRTMIYPPPSLEAAFNIIFMHNAARLTASSKDARLALLLYLLLDLGTSVTSSEFRSVIWCA